MISSDDDAVILRRQIKNPWLLLQMIVGDADTWPKFIRAAFWESFFKDRNRMVVVNFAYNNGVSQWLLEEVLTFTLKDNFTPNRRRNVAYRYSYFDDPEHGAKRRSTAYSFNTTVKAVTFLDGRIKPK